MRRETVELRKNMIELMFGRSECNWNWWGGFVFQGTELFPKIVTEVKIILDD